MNASAPKSIAEYLELLRRELDGADPAVIQDALYDAEDYLRSELAANPGKDEAALLADIVNSYGAPAEVADIYREQEVTVARAMQSPGLGLRAMPNFASSATTSAPTSSPLPAPREAPQRTGIAYFFGVALEARTYAALAYLLLSMPLGIFYFTWAVTGVSLSIGLSVLIIGIPFILLFMATVWALSLVEGRIVETLLGERMPRRPRSSPSEVGLWAKVKSILSDGRTYSTLIYMLATLPLGIFYFSVMVTLLALSLGLGAGGIGALIGIGGIYFDEGVVFSGSYWLAPVISVIGVLLLFVSLHVARGLGFMHAQIAKHLLVKAGAE